LVAGSFAVEALSSNDIAISCFRVSGLDADGDQLIIQLGQANSLLERAAKNLRAGNPMVGRQDDHHRLWIAPA